jgi:hypothetical protein
VKPRLRRALRARAAKPAELLSPVNPQSELRGRLVVGDARLTQLAQALGFFFRALSSQLQTILLSGPFSRYAIINSV